MNSDYFTPHILNRCTSNAMSCNSLVAYCEPAFRAICTTIISECVCVYGRKRWWREDVLLVTRRGTEPLHEEVRGHYICWRLHCQRCLAQTSLIKKSLKPVSVEDLEMPNGCTHGLVCNDGGDDSRNGDGLFPVETLDDETEFTRFTEQDKGGIYHFSPKFAHFFFTCHTFFPLSSVQIIIIPAYCLLCVL